LNKIFKNVLKLIKLINAEKYIYLLAKNKYFLIFLNSKWEKKDYFYFKKIFNDFNKFFKKNHIIFKNKKILEVGSGGSIGMGYFFLKSNIDSWCASDKYCKIDYSFEKNIFDQIKKNKNISKLITFSKVYNKKIFFKKIDIASKKFKIINQYDIVLSNAVFEHIDKWQVNVSLKNINHILKKDGLLISRIDLSDHLDQSNPFNFYKYSEKEWNYFTKNTIFYLNRLRKNDFEVALLKNGFKIIKQYNFKEKMCNVTLADCFKTYSVEDLETKGVLFICKKIN